MTIEWYIEHGFDISAQLSAEVLKRAEDNIIKCYLLPIVDGVPNYDEDLYTEALANLTFLLLAQQNMKVTRAGAKVKETDTSDTVAPYEIAPAYYELCYKALYDLCESTGRSEFPKMQDVCRLFYKSNYFYT